VAKTKPTIVLLQVAGAVLTPWREEAAAVASLFFAGEQTGRAWAAVLFGDAAPAGKLPVAFPASETDAIEPSSGPQVRYEEGLLTSYRSPTFKAAYPFGHGLSYTRFKYSRPELHPGPSCPQALCIRVAVANAGRREGVEVVQAYVHFDEPPAQEPKLVLRSFQRTRLLNPGESQDVLLVFRERDLSVYKPGIGWERPLHIAVHVGASSADIRHVVAIPGAAHRSGSARWTAALVAATLPLLHW